MFYSLNDIPIPPPLDFNHVTPSSQEAFDSISNALSKRTKITTLISGISKEQSVQIDEPDKIGQNVESSFDLVI